MSTHLILQSDFEIRLFQPKLAENAFGPFLWEEGLLHLNCASFATFGLFLSNKLFSGNWLKKSLAWLLWVQAVSLELADIGLQAV